MLVCAENLQIYNAWYLFLFFFGIFCFAGFCVISFAAATVVAVSVVVVCLVNISFGSFALFTHICVCVLVCSCVCACKCARMSCAHARVRKSQPPKLDLIIFGDVNLLLQPLDNLHFPVFFIEEVESGTHKDEEKESRHCQHKIAKRGRSGVREGRWCVWEGI